MSDLVRANAYYPPPESRGGWRWLRSADEIRAVAGVDPDGLDLWAELQSLNYGGYSWSVAVIRRGYLVREAASFNVLSASRFDIWSGTKAFTATAWGLLLEGDLPRRDPQAPRVTLGSPIYGIIPEGYPLTDPRKTSITVGQVLSMTGGFRGESSGAIGTATALGAGPYEHVLGRAPNRTGVWVDKLAAGPGTQWEYSDPGYAHLSLAFFHATGREIADVVQGRVLKPIGIEHATWDVQGGGGLLGPHTNAHTGLHMSSRDLARFGYLAMHGGVWQETHLVPARWQEMATRPSQALNPAYGLGWWTNARDAYIPSLPKDLFALAGFAGNRCYVVPSLDLVVARVGTGPFVLDDRSFIAPVINAILE